jgi:carbamate kinase
VDYRKPEQRGLDRVTSSEMRHYLDAGHFPPGSMGPKIESVIRYVECSGSSSIITSYDRLMDALAGNAGTTIVPDPPLGDAR